ncbi:cardiolipin synthase [Acholeplasma vituli]|uniref:Cardiolipin synthase n=1 Tax=Paracholeplasma vituli TaxID=69473 RepID=A0ABT2PWU8_9MOLU|nr:cardiolipin synthase [Paracholeplasma vituli]MCU0105426.1 cardiolipin synthase [Paracholeplasma vituli]
MTRLLRFITHRITIIGILILVQLFIFGWLVLSASKLSQWVLYSLEFLSYFVVFYVLISDEPLIYKIAWIIPILIAPIFGGFFYLFFKNHNLTKKVTAQMSKIQSYRIMNLKNEGIQIEFEDPQIKKIVHHLQMDVWPIYENTKTTFIPTGEAKFNYLLELFKAAKTCIYIEYFIINTGKAFDQIFPILKEKAAAGLDVRIIYDDFGSSMNLPNDFDKRLRKAGIQVYNFNPVRPRLNLSMNYRDHRKIVIVDHQKAITGGMNLADEYFNVIERFGHWKDASILIEGDAVKSLSRIFLTNWEHKTKQFEKVDDHHFIKMPSDGYVIPFSDSPLDRNLITKHTYMLMIQSAKKHIWITTPYFIIDQELQTALYLQATSGVEIDLFIPGIPDKKYIATVSEYYYKQLLQLPNVRIHKYNNGFIHSKIVYIDDVQATVGTTNFDFRSLYLHFENTVWLYKTSSLVDIKSYLDETLENSTLLTLESLKKRNLFYKLYQGILVGFSYLF